MGKTKKNYVSSLREALASFDLKEYKRWVKKYSPNLYKTFCSYTEEVQMGSMCKMIINRTDLLSTEAHKQAVAWLRDHNMRGQLW